VRDVDDLGEVVHLADDEVAVALARFLDRGRGQLGGAGRRRRAVGALDAVGGPHHVGLLGRQLAAHAQHALGELRAGEALGQLFGGDAGAVVGDLGQFLVIVEHVEEEVENAHRKDLLVWWLLSRWEPL
jgi:hypothetical protein